MRPTSHHRLFTLPAAFGVLALTATLLVQAYPVFAQENNDANTPPHFTISATTINVLWSDYNQASVNINSPFVAEDAEGDGFSYRLREEGSNNYFQIDTSGQLTTTDQALSDPALTGRNKDAYSVGVSVCEVGITNYLPAHCDYIRVTINVIKDKEAIGSPVIAGHSRLEHPENSVEVATYTAFTPDAKTIGWILSGLVGENDSDLFSMGHSDGVLRFKEPPDYDPTGDNSYSLSIMGYTGKHEASWLSVVVTVVDLDETPTFDGEDGDTATRAIAENTGPGVDIGEPVAATGNEGDTLTYTLGGTDAASFDIVATSGQLQTKSALDFETKASYTVTVSVRDSEDANGAADTATDDEITITITVTDANDAPEFPAAVDSRSVPENSEAGVDIGEPIAATDDDDDTLTYSLDETAAEFFHIVPTSGQLQTKAALNHETTASYTVTVSVRDSKDANGAADTAADDEITVTITVTDVNEAPEFPAAEDGLRTVPDHSEASQNIGAPVAATDDDDDTLTYTLGGTDAASFDIVSTSGQLQTKDPLDYETKLSYTVTVTATDPFRPL